MSIKHVSPIYRNKINFVLENINNGKILDAGCGYGEYLDKFREKGFKVYGIDCDKDVLKFQENVICASAEKIPIKSSTFDTVVCVDMLEHADDDESIMKEMLRVLKENGKLIITVPSSNFPITYDPINWILNRFGMKAPIGLWKWGHKRLYSRKQIENLLQQNGMKIIKFEGQSHIFVSAFVNYVPWAFRYFFSPIFNRLQKNREYRKKFLFLDKITDIPNKIDKKYFSHTPPVSLCFVSVKNR